MKTIVSAIFFLCLATGQAFAQETPQETAALDRIGPWKLINTAIFVLLLGWFIAKQGPRFFNARSADIQKAIRDATGLKMDADLRYSEIDRRMASLSEEVNKLREQARLESEREHERVRQQTAAEVARIRQNAANEIDALRGEAAKRVQAHTAEIALGLAEKRLRDQFVQGEPNNLVEEFVDLIERGKN
ncbi:MAG TPA: ATP synthase F0 subunit B [Bryobacteraceae bacterium]|jgi:F-type H+-transporting ATPase subunit b|nr:ATP synthase F0 subunit B [Bryobacteraceae bacterium]